MTINRLNESLADLITISDIRIDDKDNIQYKDNSGNWTTVVTSPTISTINCHGTDYAIKDNVSHYLDMNDLQIYDKKIKEYIDKRIDEKLSELGDSKYKIIIGESD